MHINSQTKIAPEDIAPGAYLCIPSLGRVREGLDYIFIFTLFEPIFTMAISPRWRLVTNAVYQRILSFVIFL